MTKKPLLILATLVILFCSAGMAVLLAQAAAADAEPAGTAAAAGGADAVPSAPAAPAPPPRIPDTSVSAGEGLIYGLSRTYGLLVSQDGGATWAERNEGLPRRHVWPFKGDRVRFLTALGVDPLRASRLVVTTADEILLSEDSGLTWRRIPVGKPMRDSVYFTSVALSPADANTILVGTSFNGFFETKDRGASWSDPSLSAGFLNRGAGFYEEISGIAYHPDDPRVICFALGFGKGFYCSSPDRKSWQKLPALGQGELVRSLRFVPAGAPAAANRRPAAAAAANGAADGATVSPTAVPAASPAPALPLSPAWALEAATRTATWRLGAERWEPAAALPPVTPEHARDGALASRRAASAERTGIYLSSFMAAEGEVDRHIAFLKLHGMNSMVVDFKEDLGIVTYDTRLELPQKMGAVSRRIKLERLLEKAHANGIYVIGRVLVFKDRNLYNWDGFRHAAWDRVSDAPWRHLISTQNEETGETVTVQREYWVDPYSQFVWEYNVAIARELQDRGVDEIQFDYIRFPSDGPLSAHPLPPPAGRHEPHGRAGVLPDHGPRVGAHPDQHRPVRLQHLAPHGQLDRAEHRDAVRLRGRHLPHVLPLPLPAGLHPRQGVPGAGLPHLPGGGQPRRLHRRGQEPDPPLRPGLPHRRRAAHGPAGLFPLPDPPARGDAGRPLLRVHPVERLQPLLHGARVPAALHPGRRRDAGRPGSRGSGGRGSPAGGAAVR